MLNATIISPDRQLTERLQQELQRSGLVNPPRILQRFADALELARFIRKEVADVVFLDAESSDHSLTAAETIAAHFPTTQVVAVCAHSNSSHLLPLMRAGVRDCLFQPFDVADLRVLLDRVKTRVPQNGLPGTPTGELFSFLPSKPGVGTSTVALNTSLAISAAKQKTLLADFDFHSGTLRFMLKLKQSNSVHDAAERAAELEEEVWSRLITEVEGLHVLAGPISPMKRPSEFQVRQLAAFWRHQYRAILVDLSGDLDPCSAEILQESKQIFLVCTAEAASLHLAREKSGFLKMLDLGDRVKLIVNRDGKHAILSPKQIEETVELPIQAVITNDYPRVQQALHEARGVGSGSALGQQFSALAAAITDRRLPKSASDTRGKQLLGWLSRKRGVGMLDAEAPEVA